MNTRKPNVMVISVATPSIPEPVLRMAERFGPVEQITAPTAPENSPASSDVVIFIGDPQEPGAEAAIVQLKAKHPFMIWWSTVSIDSARLQDTVQRLRVNLLAVPDDSGVLEVATPEGGKLSFPAAEEFAAFREFVRRRMNVEWFWTKENRGLAFIKDSETNVRAAELLGFAHGTRVLCDRNGNAALRMPPGLGNETRFLVSPRGVNKALLRAEDLLPVEVCFSGRSVSCPSLERKSSIDSGVLGTVFWRFPELTFLLHFHPTQALIVPDATTKFPFPCGTVEEGEELIRRIGECKGDGFLIEMIHHGYLLGGDESVRQMVLSEWKRTLDEHEKHLQTIGEADILKDVTRHPIFSGSLPLGVFLVHREGWGAIYVRPDKRGRRLGAFLAGAVAARGMNIGAHDDCRVLGFYERLGWQICGRRGKINFLAPPSASSK